MKRKVERGRPLSELVKGSLDYALNQVRTAFQQQLVGDERPSLTPYDLYIEEVFADHLIVRRMGEPPDEYYLVPFQIDPAGGYVFAPVADWESVELAYQPQGQSIGMAVGEQAVSENAGGRRRGKRLSEPVGPRAQLLAESAAAGAATRRIQIKGLMTAGVINGNGRRYPAAVLEAAVGVWRTHLHESAGQGRLQLLTGEADHPHEKGHKTARFLETLVRWDDVSFDGTNVDVAGELILTSRGRDVLTLMEAGVLPGGSVRGYYESTKVRVGEDFVEEVSWCEITGADLVGDPSFANRVDMLESRLGGNIPPVVEGDEAMDPEKLKEFIQQHPELFKGLLVDEVQSMSEAQIKNMEERLRNLLGIAPEENLSEALQEAVQARQELAAAKQQKAVNEAVLAATKSLPYGPTLNKAFAEALAAAKPATPDAVQALAESKRKEYDQIASAQRLGSMGRVEMLGSVLESETGTPEFARGAHEFTEALVRRGVASRRNLAQPRNENERVAARVLERYDQVYRLPLLRESRMVLEETELSSDLNLPYSVSRAIIAEVWPQLIATSVFDVDVTTVTPARVYYEDYQDVSGKHVVITNESVTADLDAWVARAHGMVEPGTVVVTNSGGTVTYTEGTDYMIDYLDGKIYCPSGLTITDSQSLLADYHYDKVREGENAAIQRAKMVTNYTTLDCKANRLATQVTNEAMVFSRSQIGWDATTQTLAGLIAELRREIDRALLYTALSRTLMVASNSGGTWTAATDPLIDWVKYLGVAKVKVEKRYFEPQFILMSTTNSDQIGNWDGFTQAGGRVDSGLNANGYAYRLKGLPVFAATEFSDAYCMTGNKQVIHYRIYQPPVIKGPYPSYDSNGNLIAADQWYVETYDGWVSPVAGKGAYMKVA